jgi:hypothetical protein
VPVGSGAVNPRSVAGKSISPPGAAVDPGTQEADNPEQKNG